MTGPLLPDKAEAQRFLELLAEETEAFCFQTFDDSPAKRPALARTLHGTLDELWPTLVKLNQAGAGVFVADVMPVLPPAGPGCPWAGTPAPGSGPRTPRPGPR